MGAEFPTDPHGTPLVLTLYTRLACPLCEHAALALAILRSRFPIDIVEVDVDEEPALKARFGDRVPVVMHDETELCAGRCDPDTLRTGLLGVINPSCSASGTEPAIER